jgi:hypothetical protein
LRSLKVKSQIDFRWNIQAFVILGGLRHSRTEVASLLSDRWKYRYMDSSTCRCWGFWNWISYKTFSIKKHLSPFIGVVLTGINIELFLLTVSMMPRSGKVYLTGLTKSW